MEGSGFGIGGLGFVVFVLGFEGVGLEVCSTSLTLLNSVNDVQDAYQVLLPEAGAGYSADITGMSNVGVEKLAITSPCWPC